MSVLGIVALITSVVVVIVCTASYFLFFAYQSTHLSDTVYTTDLLQKPSDILTQEDAEYDTPDISSPSGHSTAEQAVEMVDSRTITVNMAYDSGEGIYTGEVNSAGAPNGKGSFIMVDSDTNTSWSYNGQWADGVITGEGTMTQDDFIFSGSFQSGLLDRYSEIKDHGILRYAGMCKEGQLHGEGTLYTCSGLLLFEGEFDSNMLVESETARHERGTAFQLECADMDDELYDACIAEAGMFGLPVTVWGFPWAMSEQTAKGTVIIYQMGDEALPVCLVYRYGVDEPKMTSDNWISAWGVVAGVYEFTDGDGLTVTCPKIEVVYWENE